MGGLFGVTGVDKIKVAQDIAVKQSRLKIPLIFGSDIIHGYKTIFPIPGIPYPAVQQQTS